METIITIFSVIFLIGTGYVLFRNQKIDKSFKRSQDTYKYRCDLIDRDYDAYLKLPEFSEMSSSNKPLEDKYWIN